MLCMIRARLCGRVVGPLTILEKPSSRKKFKICRFRWGLDHQVVQLDSVVRECSIVCEKDTFSQHDEPSEILIPSEYLLEILTIVNYWALPICVCPAGPTQTTFKSTSHLYTCHGRNILLATKHGPFRWHLPVSYRKTILSL